MQRLVLKRYVRILFLSVFILFVANKFYIRPWVLAHSTIEVLKILVLSLPNFIEAVMGTIIINSWLIWLKPKSKYINQLSHVQRYLAAGLIAAVYVISQEFKIHNIGGNNVFDPYDVLASVLGLIFTFVLFSNYGFARD